MTEKKYTRSPRFPIYSLPKALEKVRSLYAEHKRIPVAIEAALTAMGHKSTSSKGLQTLAALGYYGLVDTAGIGAQKKAQLSQLAFAIIADNRPESIEREQRIQEAALKPKKFHEIYSQYKEELPGDNALIYELKVNHGFTDSSVHDFLRVFKETMKFAKIYESGIIEEEKGDEEENLTPQIGESGMTNTATITQPSSNEPKPKSQIERIGYLKARPGLAFDVTYTSDGLTITQEDIDSLVDLLKLIKKGYPKSTTPDSNNINEPSNN